MEFRINLLISFLTVLLAYITSALTYSVILFHVDSIGNWGYFDILFLIGTAAIVDGLFQSFTYFGIMQIPNLVGSGDLDFILLKPINSMFLVSFRSFDLGTFIAIIIGIVSNIIAIVNMESAISVINIVIYYFMIINGAIIIYSLFFLTKCLAFKFIRVNGLNNLVWAIYEFGRRTPESVYKGLIKFALIYIFPVLVVSNFPAGFFLNILGWKELIISCVITIVLLSLSIFAWNYSIKKYNSASS
jgi:ABC-2 type transport system permease protein